MAAHIRKRNLDLQSSLRVCRDDGGAGDDGDRPLVLINLDLVAIRPSISIRKYYDLGGGDGDENLSDAKIKPGKY